MSPSSIRPTSADTAATSDPADVADAVVAAIEGVPGCAGLAAGPVGTAATLLPGRRIAGLRITDQSTEVHIAVAWGKDVREVAERVRDAVTTVVGGRIDVVVEDIVG